MLAVAAKQTRNHHYCRQCSPMRPIANTAASSIQPNSIHFASTTKRAGRRRWMAAVAVPSIRLRRSAGLPHNSTVVLQRLPLRAPAAEAEPARPQLGPAQLMIVLGTLAQGDPHFKAASGKPARRVVVECGRAGLFGSQTRAFVQNFESSSQMDPRAQQVVVVGAWIAVIQ